MKAVTPDYIDGEFVEPHGREVMDSVNPTNNTVIGRVMLAWRITSRSTMKSDA
jgi:aldehyde dehydrogenase (NAD+)